MYNDEYFVMKVCITTRFKVNRNKKFTIHQHKIALDFFLISLCIAIVSESIG